MFSSSSPPLPIPFSLSMDFRKIETKCTFPQHIQCFFLNEENFFPVIGCAPKKSSDWLFDSRDGSNSLLHQPGGLPYCSAFSPPMPSLLHHICLSHLSVISLRHICPSHLSVTSVGHVCPSRLSLTSVRHVCPSHQSVMSVHNVCLSHMSVTYVCHICLLCLSITSIHYIYPLCTPVTSVHHILLSCFHHIRLFISLFITSVRHVCPSRLWVRHVNLSSPSIMSVCHICPFLHLSCLPVKSI